MLNKDQSQNVEKGGAAIQAGGSVTVVNVGVTPSEARQIALDVAKLTFYELTGTARETASIRVEDITDQVIKKLERDYPAGLQKATDPDFQYALSTVQKEYARNGDKDLGDLLVDLLVDRSKQDQRGIMQIVLNESLNTAPKLTESHLAALAVMFLFKHTQNFQVRDHVSLGSYLDEHLLPFVGKIAKNHASYQHLEFTGCGSRGMAGITLEQLFGIAYHGQFLTGFDSSTILDGSIDMKTARDFFNVCVNDKTKLQVDSNNHENLQKKFDNLDVSTEDRAIITNLFNAGKMNDEEIASKLIEIRPYMAEVIQTWNNSAMPIFALTSVGMAIGHANIKRLVGEFAKLDIWIN